MPVTEDMLNAIPDEWKREIEACPDKPKGLDDDFIKKIDAMLILYSGRKSNRNIAAVCGCKEHVVYHRYLELKNKGLL